MRVSPCAASGWTVAAVLLLYLTFLQTGPAREASLLRVPVSNTLSATEARSDGVAVGGGRGVSTPPAPSQAGTPAPTPRSLHVLPAPRLPPVRPTQQPAAPFSLRDPRTFRIGISLVVMVRADNLRAAVESLRASEMGSYSYTIFYWCNHLTSEAASYIRKVEGVNLVEVPNTTGENAGIVVPRMAIMDAMMAAQPPLHYFLEMHDDMYFFPDTPWVSNALKFDAPDIGILLPFIFNAGTMPEHGASVLQSLIRDGDPAVSSRADLVAAKVLYERCIQIHPWFLKRELIEDVGYFDPDYSPNDMEDDDFYCRTMVRGWKILAVRASWALHYGGVR